MCVGENLRLTFLKTVTVPRKIFVKLWAVHLYTVAERKWNEEKTLKLFLLFFSRNISNATSRSKQLGPETKSDNEKREKAILAMTADLIILFLFRCSIFHSALTLLPNTGTTSGYSKVNDKETDCSTKDNYADILMLYVPSHTRIRSILGYSPTVKPENSKTYIKPSRIWLSLLKTEIKKEISIAYDQTVRIQNVLAIVKH